MAACEKLFVQQAQSFEGDPIAWDRTLPVSEVTWARYYESTRPEMQEPWWVHREHDSGTFTGLLWIDPALSYFAGHFPGDPILPGIVQVQWSLAVAEEVFVDISQEHFSGLSQLKFKARVLPGAWLKLQLSRRDQAITFAYSSPECVHSQGIMKYRE